MRLPLPDLDRLVRSCTLAAAFASTLAGASACRGTAAPAPAPAPSISSANAPNASARDTAARAATERDTAARATSRGELRTARFWSPSLGATKAYRVWLPPGYDRDVAARYPVAFYLHGIFGSETDWTEQGGLDATLDSLAAGGLAPMIVVMPDGDDSFYTTTNALLDPAACRRAKRREPPETYCVAWGRYDEYVARDLVRHVDSTYRTRADRAHRAIAGLSMGGYGAVTLALRYPDVFAAAASHSGVLSPMLGLGTRFTPPPRYATSVERLRETWTDFWPLLVPAFGGDMAGWLARDPARHVERSLASGAPVPALWLDAGTDDPVIAQNRAFHWELDRLGVAHEWRERPGKHDWDYWRANAPHSLGWLAARIAR